MLVEVFFHVFHFLKTISSIKPAASLSCSFLHPHSVFNVEKEVSFRLTEVSQIHLTVALESA